MDFKVVAWLAAGVVIGVALGGIPARRELAAMRVERDAAVAKLAQTSRPNFLQAFLPVLNAREAAPQGAPAAQPQQAQATPTTATAPDALPPTQGGVTVIGAKPEPASGELPEHAKAAEATAQDAPTSARSEAAEPSRRRGSDLVSSFDQLVTAQRLRTAAARSALIEQVGLNAEQIARFDAATASMNGRLAGYGEELIAQVASDEPPSPAQALGLGHDVSGILYEGQKELDTLVGEEGKDVDHTALEIWTYVDIEQWRPYVEQFKAREQSVEGGAPPGATDSEPSK